MASVSPAAAVYGVTKLLGEQLGLLYAQRHGIGFSGMRFSSVYGERQHARAVNANFIAETHDRIRRGERPVIVGDGREVHDYVHVTDVAAGCIAAMLHGRGGQVLNLCTGVDTTHTTLVETLLQVCGATGLHAGLPRRHPRGEVGRRHASRLLPGQGAAGIGWEAAVDLRAGLARTSPGERRRAAGKAAEHDPSRRPRHRHRRIRRGLTYEAIPEAVRERARIQMLDAVGVGFAANAFPFADKAMAGIVALGGAGDCSVVGRPERLPLRDAALVNGVLMHGLDFDDTHLASIVHPSVATLPCALALGEHAMPTARRCWPPMSPGWRARSASALPSRAASTTSASTPPA